MQEQHSSHPPGVMVVEHGGAQVQIKQEIKLEELGKYALEQFKYVGDQRMKTFNYYAIVVAAAIAGSIAAFDKCPWQLVVGMGVVHFFMAWIFFAIDIRNCRLVHAARQALIAYEHNLPDAYGIIQMDDRQPSSGSKHASGSPGVDERCDRMKKRRRAADVAWKKQHWFRAKVNKWIGQSFTLAFNAAFILQVLCGVGLIAAAYFLKGPGASGH